MHPNPRRRTLRGGAVIALAGLASLAYAAAEPTADPSLADGNVAPIVVAQQTGAGVADANAAMADPYPAYQRGVRQAARKGNEALRRYIWRTRTIYDFQFRDFSRE